MKSIRPILNILAIAAVAFAPVAIYAEPNPDSDIAQILRDIKISKAELEIPVSHFKRGNEKLDYDKFFESEEADVAMIPVYLKNSKYSETTIFKKDGKIYLALINRMGDYIQLDSKLFELSDKYFNRKTFEAYLDETSRKSKEADAEYTAYIREVLADKSKSPIDQAKLINEKMESIGASSAKTGLPKISQDENGNFVFGKEIILKNYDELLKDKSAEFVASPDYELLAGAAMSEKMTDEITKNSANLVLVVHTENGISRTNSFDLKLFKSVIDTEPRDFLKEAKTLVDEQIKSK